MTVVDSMERSLRELPPDERDKVARTFISFLQTFKTDVQPRSTDQQRALLERLDAVLLIWNAMGSGKSDSFVRALGHFGELGAPEPSLAELEKLNTANRFAQWHQAVRESFSTGELAENGVSRQQLEQWRKRHRLIGLQPPFGRGFVYPAWEFNRDARPLEVIPDLVEAAEDARLDPLSLHRLMVSETATPDGPLMNALKAGEDEYVLSVVRAAGSQGS